MKLPGTLWALILLIPCKIHGVKHNVEALFPIKSLHVVFNHGARTRNNFSETYPRDPYGNETFRPYGFGALTHAGKATMYKFGEFLRNRYRHKSGYLKLRDVTCWSNDVEYSKSSASLVLASLLKPRTDEIWNTKLQWQPANVKYLPWPMDKLFFGHYCPRYSSELKRVISENKLWRNMTLSLRNLAEETGKDMQRPDDVYRIYQNYLSLVNCKLNPPKALQHSLDLLEKASQLRLKLGSATRLLRQLNGGELLKKVLQDVEGSMQGKPGPYLTLYSGHETVLAGFLNCLEIARPPASIGYAHAIAVELRQNSITKGFFITLNYFADNFEEVELTVRRFSELSYWQEFYRIVKGNVANNFTRACGRPTPAPLWPDVIYS